MKKKMREVLRFCSAGGYISMTEYKIDYIKRYMPDEIPPEKVDEILSILNGYIDTKITLDEYNKILLNIDKIIDGINK